MSPSSFSMNFIMFVWICEQSLQCPFRHICNARNPSSSHLLRHSDQHVLYCSIQMFPLVVERIYWNWINALNLTPSGGVPRYQWVSSKSGSWLTNFGVWSQVFPCDVTPPLTFDGKKNVIFFAFCCKLQVNGAHKSLYIWWRGAVE